MSESGAPVENSWIDDEEKKKKILKERARQLAKEPDTAAESSRFIKVLTFMLAGERYAIETGFVVETTPLVELTPLPGLPSFLLGIVNIRGRILSVMDIKKFFELPETGLTDLHKLIVVRHRELEVGIVADVLLGITAIAPDDLDSTLPTLTGVREKYLAGVTGEGTIVLSMGAILSDERIVINQEG